MSFPRYSDYKGSGVEWLGNIPGHWKTCRARYLFEIKKRISGSTDYDILSITQKGIRKKDTSTNDGQLSEDYSKYQIVEPGDFAMNHMDLLTGFVDVSTFYGVTSPDYRVFSIKDVEVDDRQYYLYLLQNGYIQRIFYAFGQGASQLGRWRLPTEQFQDFVLPRPPINEQRAIATFLDRETAKIDALVAEQERLIALLKEKRQAVISHAVTKGLDPNVRMKDSDVEWLGEVPEHWEVVPLKKYASDVIDYRGKTPEKTDSGVFLVTAKNVRQGYIDYDESQEYVSEHDYSEVMRRGLPKKGDILFTTEAPLGNVALVDREDIALAQRIILFRMNESAFLSSFVLFGMTSAFFQAQLKSLATGSTAEGIKASKLNELFITMPPVKEQIAISEHCSASMRLSDDGIEKAMTCIELLRERRSALISAAVTGKIDVRSLVQTEEAA
jgi:type I restriction enzyme S subunit